jgi:hypothetical protein
MDERLIHDPILTRFRAALDEIYGAPLARVVLFGSQARREARPDSHCDVAVFLKRYPTAGPNSTSMLICASASLTPPPYAPPLAGGEYGRGRHASPCRSYRDTVDPHEIRDGLDL